MKGKKEMKKTLAILLTLAMLIPSMASCQNAPTTEQVASTNSSSAPEVQTSPVIFVVRSVSNIDTLTDNNAVYEKIKKESGIDFKLNVIPTDNWADKINLMIAGSEKFDMLNITEDAGNWSKYAQKGALKPIDDYLQYIPNITALWSSTALKSCKDAKGTLYALPRQEEFVGQCTPAIRQDWLKALNMKNPTTIKELEAYFDGILATDLNGNGKHDEIPIMPFVGTEQTNFRPYFLGFYGDRYLDANGNIKPWYMSDNAWALVAKMQEWYKKGYLYSEMFTMDVQTGFDLVTADRIGCWTGPYNAGVSPTSKARLANSKLTIEWASLDNLTDFTAGGSSAWGSNPVNMPEIVLSKTSTNAVWAFKLLNWMFANTENYMLATFGIEGQTWSYADSTKKTFKVTADKSEKYGGLYQLNEWYDTSKFPSKFIDTNDYYTWQINELRTKINKMKTIESVDWYIPYDLTNTNAESLTGDSNTQINEAYSKCVTGVWGEKEWKAAVKSAWETEGSIYSAVWTKQYNSFLGK